MDITYIREPTDLQCGQAVLAMVLGRTVEEITAFLGNDRETDLREMKSALRHFGAEISDRIRPRPEDKVIIKRFPNSFLETELDAYLKSLQVDTLIVCGMMTHMCVTSVADDGTLCAG